MHGKNEHCFVCIPYKYYTVAISDCTEMSINFASRVFIRPHALNHSRHIYKYAYTYMGVFRVNHIIVEWLNTINIIYQ